MKMMSVAMKTIATHGLGCRFLEMKKEEYGSNGEMWTEGFGRRMGSRDLNFNKTLIGYYNIRKLV